MRLKPVKLRSSSHFYVILFNKSSGYYHPSFLRGRLELATSIEPTKIKGKRGRRPKSDDNEPDFYNASSTATIESPAIKNGKPKTPKTPSPPKEETSEGTSLALSKMLKTNTDIDTGATGFDDLLRMPKEDSPDQQTLETLLQSLSKDDAAQGMPPVEFPTRLGFDSSWPNMQPTSHSLPIGHEESLLHLQQQEGLLQGSRASMHPTGAIRRPSGFSDASNAWAWDSMAAEEIPGAASLHYRQPEEPAMPFSQPFDTTGIYPSNLQLPPPQEHHLQRVLQEQRLKDLMDLNQKQQSNIKIQQEQLEQQRLELQLREQEQLQQLRIELQARGGQQLRRKQEPRRQAEPLPQAPPLFQPQLQERLLGSAVGPLRQQDQFRQQQNEGSPENGSLQIRQQQQYRRDNWLP